MAGEGDTKKSVEQEKGNMNVTTGLLKKTGLLKCPYQAK